MIYRSDRETQRELDTEFKRHFHAKRKEMFKCRDIFGLRRAIEDLLQMSEAIDRKTRFDPMQNFDSVRAELEAMLYGIEHWEQIKETVISRSGITQKELLALTKLDKDKTSLFLYRVSLFGFLKKGKSGRNNTYEYIGERIESERMVKNWEILWEVPYQSFQRDY